jgi:outer membrane protein assembly factor BamB
MRRLFWSLTLLGLLQASAGRARADLLLVSGFNSNNVVAFDASTGTFSSVFVAAGSGGLSEAEGLGFAPDGSLLVNSFGSGQVLQYSGTTGAFENAIASISSPTGMVFRGADVFVSSFYGGFVNEYNATTGTLVSTFVTPGSGGLGEAHGLTFGPDSNLYVSDSAHNDVLEYNGTTGAFIKLFASGGGLSST